jgi:hypothetical protein
MPASCNQAPTHAMDQSMVDATKAGPRIHPWPCGPRSAGSAGATAVASMNLKPRLFVLSGRTWRQATESHLRFAKLAAREPD